MNCTIFKKCIDWFRNLHLFFFRNQTVHEEENTECHFWKLPRELRDTIYYHAYNEVSDNDIPDNAYEIPQFRPRLYRPHQHKQHNFRPDTGDELANQIPTLLIHSIARHSIRDPTRRNPFPGTEWYLPNIAVSKQWLVDLSPSVMRGTTFRFPFAGTAMKDFRHFITTYPQIQEEITSVELKFSLSRCTPIPMGIAETVMSCPKLKRVVFEIDALKLTKWFKKNLPESSKIAREQLRLLARELQFLPGMQGVAELREQIENFEDRGTCGPRARDVGVTKGGRVEMVNERRFRVIWEK